ncbi:MAG TPA: NAD(P)-dependent oxidoreductase [Pyrinomonadaceae bacterium]|nr:NAD(P)-dependent oxidoreductase [Pyrinomonadaceae bacterium]
MKVLVTGANGFIGKHLVRRLQDHHEVFAVVRSHSDQDTRENVSWIEQDLAQPLNHSQLPPRVDVIIHLAQSSFYKDFPDRASDIYSVNIASTFELLEYARRAEASRFVFASTGGIYGYGREPFVETDPIKLLGFYFSSKYVAELMVKDYQQCFDTTILRLFFVYGAGQTPSMLIPRLIRSILTGDPITLNGNQGIRINPIYVKDAVNAIEAAVGLEGNHLINVAGAEVLSLREIGQAMGEQLNREPRFEYTERESGDAVADISRMVESLGSPHVPFREGLAEVCKEIEARELTGEKIK